MPRLLSERWADAPRLQPPHVNVKVLHVPFSYYPDPVGGTEVYVQTLSFYLKQAGIVSMVAAPAGQNDVYEHEGLRVYRYRVNPEPNCARELYGQGDQLAAECFDRVLGSAQPNILHLHAFSRGVSLGIVQAAKARRIPVVFTYHTPTATCQQGTMMKFGNSPCDGLMSVHNCARCTIHQLLGSRLPHFEHEVGNVRPVAQKVLAAIAGSLPPALGRWLACLNLEGNHWTALRMTELMQLRHASTRTLFAEVDHIVAVCQWVKEVLITNGVPSRKITLSRQGVAEEAKCGNNNVEQARVPSRHSLKMAFLGRLHPTKGVHILIEALRLIPDVPLHLVVYGIVQDQYGSEYEAQLHRIADRDGRIRFHSPIRSSQVQSVLRGYDLLAVPSQWLETGPLVVLEAFAAGIPVIGSRLGGISELVHDGVNGVLVQPSNPEDWAVKLRRLAEDEHELCRLRANVCYPRTMSEVAGDMCGLYGLLAEGSNGRQSVSMPELACQR